MHFKIENPEHPLRKMAAVIEFELINLNKKIKNINLGGCGVFAYEMKKMLDSLNVNTSIYIIDEECEYLDKKFYLNQVVNLQMKHVYRNASVNHVILYLNDLGVALDASGFHNIHFNSYNATFWHGLRVVGQYTMDELAHANKYSKWNHWFNRRRIPELKYYINLIKNKIEGKSDQDKKVLNKIVRTRMLWQIIESPLRFIKLYL